jgi:hypothetical protein
VLNQLTTPQKQEQQQDWHQLKQQLYPSLVPEAALQTRSFTTSRAAHADALESQVEELSSRADALEERLAVLEGQEGIRTAIHSLALMLDTANQRAKDIITL